MSQSNTTGTIIGVNGGVVQVQVNGVVALNEVAYIHHTHHNNEARLKSEIVRVRNTQVDLQVFEDTRGLVVGDTVTFSGHLLSAQLAPGLLGTIYDGLQNPLTALAQNGEVFLPHGRYVDPLSPDTAPHNRWQFTPSVPKGSMCRAGDTLGVVPEGIFSHKIMVPFELRGEWQVSDIVPTAQYTIDEPIATLVQDETHQAITMRQYWPVKHPIKAYKERLKPTDTLETGIRIIDTLIPVARGGTYCIPGPFGAGKTVLQQITSRNANVDIVIIAACGERAGEVVETLREFPQLVDPRTGRSLMERTIIIVNTSSMPVAARESSVYMAATIAEYYRQMGLHVLLLADSTSRWAQAMRELSGRLEEIPGEEAFPAYLESVIASFYERAGVVRLNDGSIGSVTIGGTVSPAGGNFEEPVTQSTLKVVGAFHGLSRERAEARKYPSINPLESWSKYPSILDEPDIALMRTILFEGDEILQMMKVVGEEGVVIEEYLQYLKADLIDTVFLQQNAFDEVDRAVHSERQQYTFSVLKEILEYPFEISSKERARSLFNHFRQLFLDWNGAPWKSAQFKKIAASISQSLANANNNPNNPESTESTHDESNDRNNNNDHE